MILSIHSPYRPLLSLRPQNLPVPQRPLQARLHLHVTKLTNGEVQVLHSLGSFIGVVLQQQLSQLYTGEGYLGAKAYLGAGFGVYQREYDQNVAFGTKDRSDLMLVPTAHFLVTNVRGSKFDFRLDYRYENNDSNDSTEDFDNHVASARIVRKF